MIYLAGIIIPGILAAILVPMAIASRASVAQNAAATISPEATANIFFMGFLAYLVVFLIVCVFADIRRLHDLGKSGWFAALRVVPLANLWLFAVCGFYKGEACDNKYGPALK